MYFHSDRSRLLRYMCISTAEILYLSKNYKRGISFEVAAVAPHTTMLLSPSCSHTPQTTHTSWQTAAVTGVAAGVDVDLFAQTNLEFQNEFER